MIRPSHRPSLFFFLLVSFATCAYLHSEDILTQDLILTDCCVLDESRCPTSLGVTFLYLRPNIDDTHYVLSSFNNTFNGSLFPNGKRHQNRPDFNPGASVEGIYTLCPETAFLTAKATFFHSNAYSSVSGGFLYDTNGFPGFGAQDTPVYAGTATSKNTYNFYSGDLGYQRHFSVFCFELFSANIGLHGAYIGFKEHTTSLGTFTTQTGQQPIQNNFIRHSEFFGIGPQVGLKYDYCLPNLWTIYAKANGALLCGYTKSELTYVTRRTGPGGVSIQNDRVWRVIPATNAELGLSYAICCGCWNVIGDLGYTFLWYGHCVNKVTGLDTAFPGDSVDMFNNFSLHGPCLKLSVNF